MANYKTCGRIKSASALRHSSFSVFARDLIYQHDKGAMCNGAVDAERQAYGAMLRGLAQARLH
ncbi:hypothetical protein [Sphingopyxis sp. MSC1_008]|uniref:hypothetical protein n=1 Tax=Sphingopyxis sp. MSC1_008 TaxID=2909265 RepID=UPI0020BDF033|nr:hypothetical protein [Sphingopyxis sp. MSC1_008]